MKGLGGDHQIRARRPPGVPDCVSPGDV